MDDFPGSRWWAFDFHTHTPASTDYRGPDSISPEDWLLGFMRAEIDCVAVTDHNCGAWVDTLKAALDSHALKDHPDYRALTLFPGIELSVNGGVHLLVLFDPSKGSADVEALRGAVGYRGKPCDSDGVTSMSLEDCIGMALEHAALPIPAHVDAAKGLLAMITDHHTLSQALRRLTALEVCEPSAEILQHHAEAIEGLSLVSGSDSHRPEAIGRRTWIKMSRPDLDGLRLALLDGALSVRRTEALGEADPNSVPEQRIVALTLRRTRYRRSHPLPVPFSPWLNTIIGGRGTGKSTLLECLRLGLNRGFEVDDLADLKSQFDSFKAVAAGRNSDGVFLPDSEVDVEYRKGADRYCMVWRPGEPAPSLSAWDGSGWQPAGPVIPSLFPVHIYSQKQVFEMAKNPRTLLRLIDNDPGLDKRGWQADWDKATEHFLKLRADERRLRAELQDRPRVDGELRDVRSKLSVFEQSRHADILTAYQESRRQQTMVDRHLDALERRLTEWHAVLSLDDDEDLAFDPADRFDGDQRDQAELLQLLGQLDHELKRGHRRLMLRIELLSARLQQARDAVAASAWQATVAGHRAAYDRLNAELQQQGVDDPSEYGRLVHQRQALEARLKELDQLAGALADLGPRIETAHEELKALRLDLTDRRRRFVQDVLTGNDHVCIELLAFGDLTRAESSLRKQLGREDGAFADDILVEDSESRRSGIVADLYRDLRGAEADGQVLLGRLDALKAALDDRHERLLETAIKKPFKKFLERTFEQTPETLDRLWCWFPEDDVKVSYRVPGSTEYRSVSQASAGQKTSAILSFLLSYGTEPLILDQPEDDLDNALIYDLIVRQIRENKRRRQIIVVSHNPNIVVHGDAEWVLPMQFRKGQFHIEHQGGLQELPVRRAICDIMEGGVEAFAQRYRKIHDQVLD